MKGKLMVAIGVIALALVFSASCFAATSKTVTVTASVPTQAGGLNVTISKILPGTGGGADTWVQSGTSLPIDFGTLTYDNTYNIFRATYYYAVDVGVVDNTGTAWTVTHTKNPVQKDATNNLDGNINVTFMKQLTSTTATQLDKVSYANSNNKAYSKSALSGGWLRIYYGIATGNTNPANGTTDASGVTPIGIDKPAGTYTGSIVITLSP